MHIYVPIGQATAQLQEYFNSPTIHFGYSEVLESDVFWVPTTVDKTGCLLPSQWYPLMNQWFGLTITSHDVFALEDPEEEVLQLSY